MLIHRPWRAGLLACMSAFVGACAGDDKAPVAPAPGQGTPPEWRGPPVRASAAPDGGVEVVVTAPTLGHVLELREVTVHGDAADADFKLTTPAEGAVVGQAVTELRARVPAGRLPKAARTVRVRIATWQDGVQYVRAPDFELAAVVAR